MGTNKGSVYTSYFGTTSPVTGSASGVGQLLDGLTGTTVIVSAPPGSTLQGSGQLQCYLYDDSVLEPNGSAQFVSASYDTAASHLSATVVFDHSGSAGPFSVGQVVVGQTSGASGTLASLTTTSNQSGSFLLVLQSGTFSGSEHLVGTTPKRAMRFPLVDCTITSTVQDQVFGPFMVITPRKGRIEWVAVNVPFAGSGSGGIKVTQLGQTQNGLLGV